MPPLIGAYLRQPLAYFANGSQECSFNTKFGDSGDHSIVRKRMDSHS